MNALIAGRTNRSDPDGCVTSSRHLRGYRAGDEDAFVRLWNRVYADYGGYVTRTVPHWKWCILDRPGISTDDIFVVAEGAKILGYGVLGPKGQVLELAIEPTLSLEIRRETAHMLCEVIEERAINRGDEMIRVPIPATDAVIGGVLRDRDFGEEMGEFLNMTVLDPVALVRDILEHRRAVIPQGWRRTFLFELANGHYRFNPRPRIYIAIGERLIVESAATEQSADCRIQTDLSVFTDIVFNREEVLPAVQSGRLTVDSSSGVSAVEQLLRLVTLRSPWYSPHADGR